MGSIGLSVIVVGAGIGGLHAAHHLVRRGAEVTVLEARPHVGGRLRSTPLGLDLGASWFWPGERRVAALVDELGVAVHDQHLAGDAMYDDATRAIRLDGNPIDVESFRFTTGAGSLATALAERLSAHDRSHLRTGSHVHSIDVEHPSVDDPDRERVGGGAVRVRFDTHLSGSEAIRDDGDDGGDDGVGTTLELRADHVVMALPPALASATIRFRPRLATDLYDVAERTPVWMGAVTKIVARYESAFWREAGLSGSAVSHRGPMNEVHDLSGPGGHPAALFGFARTSASSGPVDEAQVVAQLVRLFGPRAASPLDLSVADWRAERFTSPAGVETRVDHSLFGHRVFQQPALGGRLHWASTETSPVSAGHIEGALAAAERAVGRIVDSTAATDFHRSIGSPP